MFQEELLRWYKQNARKLVFRQKKEAYSIWVSEIMAQQTRIEAMLPYFERFIERYPNLKSLAQAEDDDLVKIWQGLGYYNRVRNMKRCAIQCVEQFQGQFPKTKKELCKLPGIGEYTAGAIASIAFDEKVSAVDGNVIRVFSRFYHITDDVSQMSTKKKITELVNASLTEPISDYNQALMELGALVCIPKNPRCAACPIQKECQSYAYGDADSLPVLARKKPRRVENPTFYIWVCQDKIHLKKRSQKGLLAGLFGFDETLPEAVEEKRSLEPYTHIFSHVEWHMKGIVCFVKEKSEDFYSLSQIHDKVSIPSAFQPFLKQTERIIKEREKCQKSL